MVELCPADTGVGLNETVVPAGCPEALKLIVCALPETTAVPIELVPDEPCWMERLDGLAEMEKSLDTPVTVSATAVECDPDAAVPVTVIV